MKKPKGWKKRSSAYGLPGLISPDETVFACLAKDGEHIMVNYDSHQGRVNASLYVKIEEVLNYGGDTIRWEPSLLESASLVSFTSDVVDIGIPVPEAVLKWIIQKGQNL